MTATDSGSGSGGGWLIGGRYRVIDRIGSGGMAEVFRAHDETLDRDVAVKVFRSVSTSRDTAVGAERQRTELQTLARLAHPNLITLFDGSLGNESEGEPSYLVMELIDGSTLADAIERDAVSAGEARAVGAQIAAALAYVHAANLVHRDVKPANILLGTDATAGSTTVRARLSDFGIVRLVGDDAAKLTGTQFTLGTASYLAPEQVRGSSVGPPADVYALGLVLLETLTRTRAFDGPPMEAAMARLGRDPQIPSNLPAPWPQLLAAMTRQDPAQRPTAQQVVDVLGQGDAGTTAATTVFVPPPPQGPPTAATTVIPSGPPPGPVRRAPVSDTRAMPPVPPVVVPPARRAAPPPEPRRPLPTIVWLAIAAVVVVIIILIIVLLASNGGGSGGSSPSSTPRSSSSSSSSSRASSSDTSAPPSSASSSTRHKKHSSSSSPTRTRTSSSSSTSKPPTTKPPSTPKTSASSSSP